MCDCRVLFAEGVLCHNSAARVCEGVMCRDFAFFDGMLSQLPRNELRGIFGRWGSRIQDEDERGQMWGGCMRIYIAIHRIGFYKQRRAEMLPI
jgi:hypothetical protein